MGLTTSVITGMIDLMNSKKISDKLKRRFRKSIAKGNGKYNANIKEHSIYDTGVLVVENTNNYLAS